MGLVLTMHSRSPLSLLLFSALCFTLLCPFFGPLHAQGVTTGTLSGIVRANNSRGPVMGATTVRAVQQGTGSVYGAISLPNGRYSIRGMRPGLCPTNVAVTLLHSWDAPRTV